MDIKGGWRRAVMSREQEEAENKARRHARKLVYAKWEANPLTRHDLIEILDDCVHRHRNQEDGSDEHICTGSFIKLLHRELGG